MRSYSVAEARDHFEEMLEHVRTGEIVALTDNGVIFAELQPKEVDRKALVERLGKDLKALRAKIKPVTQEEISEWRRIGQKP